MLEQNIHTLSSTSKFTLLKPCDNRILSHFLMGFFYHYTMILHSCPFSLPFLLQTQPLCIPDKPTLVPGVCSPEGTEELRLSSLHYNIAWPLLRVTSASPLSFLAELTEKGALKIIAQSYQECHKGRDGK